MDHDPAASRRIVDEIAGRHGTELPDEASKVRTLLADIGALVELVDPVMAS